MYDGIKTVWVSQLHDFPQTDKVCNAPTLSVLPRAFFKYLERRDACLSGYMGHSKIIAALL